MTYNILQFPILLLFLASDDMLDSFSRSLGIFPSLTSSSASAVLTLGTVPLVKFRIDQK